MSHGMLNWLLNFLPSGYFSKNSYRVCQYPTTVIINNCIKIQQDVCFSAMILKTAVEYSLPYSNFKNFKNLKNEFAWTQTLDSRANESVSAVNFDEKFLLRNCSKMKFMSSDFRPVSPRKLNS